MWVYIIAGICIFGAVGIYTLLNGNPDAPPVIRTEQDYEEAMGRVVQYTKGPFQKGDDEPLTPGERQDLRKALVQMQGITGFNPAYNHFFIAGKICFLLGDYESAQTFFDQCVEQPWPDGTNPDFYIQTVAEAHYLLSKCFFLEDKFQKAADEAATAATHFQNSAQYKFAEAQADAQLGHIDTAIGLLQDVLRIDPQNAKARHLLGFVLLGQAQQEANLHHKQKALNLCRELVTIDPRNPDVDQLVRSLTAEKG